MALKDYRRFSSLGWRFHRSNHVVRIFLDSTASYFLQIAILSFFTLSCQVSAQPDQPYGDASRDSNTGLTNHRPPHQNDAQNHARLVHLDKNTDYDQESTWTFSNPGISYMDFSPKLRKGQDQHFRLSFRTQRANGLLLHQHVVGVDGTGTSSVLFRYQLFMELRQGSLRVGIIVNQYQDFLTTGKALNNDAWHSVHLVVDVDPGQLQVTLDGKITKETIKAYTWGNAAELLVWNDLTPVVTLGDTRLKSIPVRFEPFVGCLRNVQYTESEGYLHPKFNVTEGVTPGCLDRCLGDRSCGPGRCINLYTPGVLCDCHGTNFEGPRCDLEGERAQ
ncbi:contactin-associated protein-like 5 [Plakobranchus ocellatus]|uniref:Contactin-associated protein-like 5 n=1 Tax=Plakobranchus ocellatus TaxID=259542 RepID=A0AAV4BIF3_9GAST|nr:contactin-associated protein-like 5 [Plakobranchus ocellatus]